MKLGIFGGSFDPIHNGHLHMAVNACRFFALDQVLFVPAGHSPNKDETRMTDGMHRLRMCELAAMSDAKFAASSIEVDAAERSYTYRTLEKFKERYPSDELYFIMGGDSLDYFEQWVKPDRICALATILVVPRDQFDTKALEERISQIRQLFFCDIRIVPCSMHPLSSTQVRNSLRSGNPDPSDFPEGVLDYIREHHLYGCLSADGNG